MSLHVFRDNVNIHAPGKDPGAQFYAWVWHKHFPGQRMLSCKDFLEAANQELVSYLAVMSQDHDKIKLQIKFRHAEDYMRFMLAWQGG